MIFGNLHAAGFRIELHDGKFYGPGDLGDHDIHDGSLENFIVTAPMTGLVPFLNNGADEPNVVAEAMHYGPVDGVLSDGTKINENVNAAFVLEVEEPETKMPVKLFVGSVSEEIVQPDDNDNLTFNLHAAFDSGFAKDALQLPVQFITGAVEVPVSEKNKRGLSGGHDHAGTMSAGTVYIGRLGDFDQDGFMDGVFVLAGNTPYELLIAEGDPVLIVRPFKSDIPINPKEASYYELNGVVRNFKKPILDTLSANQHHLSTNYLMDVKNRVNAVVSNIQKAKFKRKDKDKQEIWQKGMQKKLSESLALIEAEIKNLQTNKTAKTSKIESMFMLMGDVHSIMQEHLNKRT